MEESVVNQLLKVWKHSSVCSFNEEILKEQSMRYAIAVELAETWRGG
jgi:hypothetical protein